MPAVTGPRCEQPDVSGGGEDGPPPGAEALAGSGVRVAPVPDCGHHITLDNPEAFVRAPAKAPAVTVPQPDLAD
ncbi:hypothetical protein [Streptomyces lavendofoliae]|uniref:hypothetical protein n=1 Tax=Streptomyces lavendofoliae TaxID=67314 RepID=UPI0016739B3E